MNGAMACSLNGLKILIACLLFPFMAGRLAAQDPCDVTLDVTTPITCPGDNNGVITVNGAPGPYNYFWDHDPTLSTASANNLPPGDYTVLVTGPNGCVSYLELTLSDPYVPPLGTLTVTNISCAGANDGSITFTLNPGLNNQWQWTHNPNLTATTISNLIPNGYGVRIFDPPNCPSVIWTFLDDPDIEIIGSADYCPGAPPLLTLDNLWGFQPTSWLWSTGHTGNSLQVVPGMEGPLSVVATNDAGCTADADIVLTQLPSPTVQMGLPDSMCQYSEFNVNTLVSDADSLVWRWEGTGFSNDSIPLVSFKQPYWRPISLQGFDAFGCGSEPVQDSIYIIPILPAEFSVEQIPCSPTVGVDLRSMADSCQFLVGDSLICTKCDFEFVHDLEKYAVYDFQFISYQASGCNDTTYATVDVRTEPTLFLPNAFSPNEDGINEEWPGAIEVSDLGYELMIFNRIGNLIWSTKDTTEHWTGEGAPNGMYVYKMRMRDPCNTTDEVARTGYIVLLR